MARPVNFPEAISNPQETAVVARPVNTAVMPEINDTQRLANALAAVEPAVGAFTQYQLERDAEAQAIRATRDVRMGKVAETDKDGPYLRKYNELKGVNQGVEKAMLFQQRLYETAQKNRKDFKFDTFLADFMAAEGAPPETPNVHWQKGFSSQFDAAVHKARNEYEQGKVLEQVDNIRAHRQGFLLKSFQDAIGRNLKGDEFAAAIAGARQELRESGASNTELAELERGAISELAEKTDDWDSLEEYVKRARADGTHGDYTTAEGIKLYPQLFKRAASAEYTRYERQREQAERERKLTQGKVVMPVLTMAGAGKMSADQFREVLTGIQQRNPELFHTDEFQSIYNAGLSFISPIATESQNQNAAQALSDVRLGKMGYAEIDALALSGRINNSHMQALYTDADKFAKLNEETKGKAAKIMEARDGVLRRSNAMQLIEKGLAPESDPQNPWGVSADSGYHRQQQASAMREITRFAMSADVSETELLDFANKQIEMHKKARDGMRKADPSQKEGTSRTSQLEYPDTKSLMEAKKANKVSQQAYEAHAAVLASKYGIDFNRWMPSPEVPYQAGPGLASPSSGAITPTMPDARMNTRALSLRPLPQGTPPKGGAPLPVPTQGGPQVQPLAPQGAPARVTPGAAPQVQPNGATPQSNTQVQPPAPGIPPQPQTGGHVGVLAQGASAPQDRKPVVGTEQQIVGKTSGIVTKQHADGTVEFSAPGAAGIRFAYFPKQNTVGYLEPASGKFVLIDPNDIGKAIGEVLIPSFEAMIAEGGPQMWAKPQAEGLRPDEKMPAPTTAAGGSSSPGGPSPQMDRRVTEALRNEITKLRKGLSGSNTAAQNDAIVKKVLKQALDSGVPREQIEQAIGRSLKDFNL